MTTQQEEKIKTNFLALMRAGSSINVFNWERTADWFLARFREMEGECKHENTKPCIEGTASEVCRDCGSFKYMKNSIQSKPELSQCCGAERQLHDFPKESTCANCDRPFKSQYDRCECKNCMQIDLKDRCEKGCDDIDCKPPIPRQEKECPYCDIVLDLPKHNEELFQWHLNGHQPVDLAGSASKPTKPIQKEDNKESWWEEPFRNKFFIKDEMGYFIPINSPELIAFQKSFIRQVEERARKEAIEKVEAIIESLPCRGEAVYDNGSNDIGLAKGEILQALNELK